MAPPEAHDDDTAFASACRHGRPEFGDVLTHPNSEDALRQIYDELAVVEEEMFERLKTLSEVDKRLNDLQASGVVSKVTASSKNTAAMIAAPARVLLDPVDESPREEQPSQEPTSIDSSQSLPPLPPPTVSGRTGPPSGGSASNGNFACASPTAPCSAGMQTAPVNRSVPAVSTVAQGATSAHSLIFASSTAGAAASATSAAGRRSPASSRASRGHCSPVNSWLVSDSFGDPPEIVSGTSTEEGRVTVVLRPPGQSAVTAPSTKPGVATSLGSQSTLTSLFAVSTSGASSNTTIVGGPGSAGSATRSQGRAPSAVAAAAGAAAIATTAASTAISSANTTVSRRLQGQRPQAVLRMSSVPVRSETQPSSQPSGFCQPQRQSSLTAGRSALPLMKTGGTPMRCASPCTAIQPTSHQPRRMPSPSQSECANTLVTVATAVTTPRGRRVAADRVGAFGPNSPFTSAGRLSPASPRGMVPQANGPGGSMRASGGLDHNGAVAAAAVDAVQVIAAAAAAATSSRGRSDGPAVTSRPSSPLPLGGQIGSVGTGRASNSHVLSPGRGGVFTPTPPRGAFLGGCQSPPVLSPRMGSLTPSQPSPAAQVAALKPHGNATSAVGQQSKGNLSAGACSVNAPSNGAVAGSVFTSIQSTQEISPSERNAHNNQATLSSSSQPASGYSAYGCRFAAVSLPGSGVVRGNGSTSVAYGAYPYQASRAGGGASVSPRRSNGESASAPSTGVISGAGSAAHSGGCGLGGRGYSGFQGNSRFLPVAPAPMPCLQAHNSPRSSSPCSRAVSPAISGSGVTAAVIRRSSLSTTPTSSSGVGVAADSMISMSPHAQRGALSSNGVRQFNPRDLGRHPRVAA
eukprot:TRINITY_DN17810_c0_g1_i1.p1 TRINITY_DN17810_c0_g1~~TRINITY_DN17810_c0_g1_i1.p1  ORF type:complete len:859 (+),score=103.88 TRINITY_DN17810_c0_g1_i1:79-2655(+)